MRCWESKSYFIVADLFPPRSFWAREKRRGANWENERGRKLICQSAIEWGIKGTIYLMRKTLILAPKCTSEKKIALDANRESGRDRHFGYEAMVFFWKSPRDDSRDMIKTIGVFGAFVSFNTYFDEIDQSVFFFASVSKLCAYI